MRLILLEAVSKPVHHHQLIGRRKVLLDHTSAACRLHGGGVVSFVIVTGGVPPVSVASHMPLGCVVCITSAWTSQPRGQTGMGQVFTQICACQVGYSASENVTMDPPLLSWCDIFSLSCWGHNGHTGKFSSLSRRMDSMMRTIHFCGDSIKCNIQIEHNKI